MLRLYSPRIFMTAATLSCALWAHADFHYMGGIHTFSPYSDSTSLTLQPLSSITFPLHPTKGEIRLSALMDAFPTSNEQGHGFIISAQSYTLSLTFNTIPSSDHIYDHDRLRLTIGGDLISDPATFTLTTPPDKYLVDKGSVLTISLTPSTDQSTHATILGGRSQNEIIWSTNTLPIPFSEISGIGFTAGAETPLTIHRATLSTPSAENRSNISADEIEGMLSEAADPYSGYWTVLDYALEENLLRPGGDYILVLLPAHDDGYDIIYMEGASINGSEWTPGDYKGHLRPTRLAGLYKAEWTDAEGKPLDASATLQFLGTDLAQLTLPTLHSTLRLHRLRLHRLRP